MITMKDKIADYNPIVGYITIRDLLDSLEKIAKDYKFIGNVLIEILEFNDYDNETISSLFYKSIYENLIEIIKTLRNNL